METWLIVVLVVIVLVALLLLVPYLMYKYDKETLVNMTLDDRVPDCIAAGIVADLEYISDHRDMFKQDVVDVYTGFMMVAADNLPLGKDKDRAVENIKYLQSQGYKNYRHIGDFLYLILTGRVIHSPWNILAFLKQVALMSKEYIQAVVSGYGGSNPLASSALDMSARELAVRGNAQSNHPRSELGRSVLTSYPKGVPAMGISDFKEGVYVEHPVDPPTAPWKVANGDW